MVPVEQRCLVMGLISQEVFHCPEFKLGSIGRSLILYFGKQAKELAFQRHAGCEDLGNVGRFHVMQPILFGTVADIDCNVIDDHVIKIYFLGVTFACLYLFTSNSITMNILLHAHSGLRYVVLGLLIAAVFIAYSNWQKGSREDSKVYLFALIATHTQMLIGLILYFMSPKVNFDLISEKVFRFYSIEHVFMMLIAIVLITLGRVRSKKLAGPEKHHTVLYFYAMALIIILAAIPWPFRNLGSGWF